ncbi:MAG: hypothetical protein WC815_10545 [Vicinamibacterales bacterium]|jgi:hypothetical protein
MVSRDSLKTAGGGLALGASLAALGYAGLIAYHRARYGKDVVELNDDSLLLDRFIPSPEVVEHHRVRISAPADVVMSTARSLELLHSRMIRAIFKVRELALGGHPDERRHPSALLPQMQSIGWVILAERAGREVVLGAVTRPWDAAPTFRPVPAAEFAEFREPGYVKIAWTLRADPISDTESMFHTETRVASTDVESRKRFRRYWSYVAPGVELIRLAMLAPLKKAAEHSPSAKAAHAHGH